MALANRGLAWLLAALVALLVLDPTGSPVSLVSVAALAVAAALLWSLSGLSADVQFGHGPRVPAPAPLAGPLRSFDPDAAGRPRPRAPGV